MNRTKLSKFHLRLLAGVCALAVIAGGIGYAPAAAQASELTAPVVTVFDTSTSEVQNGLVTDDDGVTYYYIDGVMQTGWVTIDNNKYYFDKTSGAMQTDRMLIGDYYYYFDTSTGIMQTGWVSIDAGKMYFKSGGRQVFGSQKIDGDYYYFDTSSGIMQTGWLKLNNKKYYYNTDGKQAFGFCKIDGSRYYFDESTGVMQTGWVKVDSKKYYFKSNGKEVFGKKKINGSYYFFNKKTGVMKTGWRTQNGKKYYYKANGKQAFGKVKAGSSSYYFNLKSGAMKTGWITIDGKKYYFNKSTGKMATGAQKISGTYYFFSKKGVLQGTLTNSMDIKAQKYSSSTNYLILVNLSYHQVRIYSGSKNNWKNIKSCTCTNGKSSTPTVTGVYTVGNKGLYFDTGTRGRCWYYTQFHGNYLFHSVIYDRSSSPTTIIDGQLGTAASHGCVRLALANAKWIYDNIPTGTTVVTYN